MPKRKNNIKWIVIDRFGQNDFFKKPDGKLVRATARLAIKGKILRDRVGGPIVFNKKGRIKGHVKVDYEGEVPNEKALCPMVEREAYSLKEGIIFKRGLLEWAKH
jgi:hypothetical protein